MQSIQSPPEGLIDAPKWELPARLGLAQTAAFRLVCLYLVLYNLPAPLGWFTGTGAIVEPYFKAWFALSRWAGKHILNRDMTTFTSWGDDYVFHYVQCLCFLVAAAAGALCWTASTGPGRLGRLYGWV